MAMQNWLCLIMFLSQSWFKGHKLCLSRIKKSFQLRVSFCLALALAWKTSLLSVTLSTTVQKSLTEFITDLQSLAVKNPLENVILCVLNKNLSDRENVSWEPGMSCEDPLTSLGALFEPIVSSANTAVRIFTSEKDRVSCTL